MRFLTAYAAAATIFLLADFVWLTSMIGFYRNTLGDLLAGKPNLLAAAALYAIYFVGIVVFAILPAAKSESWTTALYLGALLGLVSFATYDLTNLATLSRWPVLVVVIDMAWGTFISALASVFGYFILQRFAPN